MNLLDLHSIFGYLTLATVISALCIVAYVKAGLIFDSCVLVGIAAIDFLNDTVSKMVK